MAQKTKASVSRSDAKRGFTVRKEDGRISVHQSGAKTPEAVRSSISKHRDALKRLADR